MRANPVQTQRKLIPGSMWGDKAVQPGQHVVILPGPPAFAEGSVECVAGIPFDLTETFNKADGDLGPVLDWSAPSGVLEVVSNECKENSGGNPLSVSQPVIPSGNGAQAHATPLTEVSQDWLVEATIKSFPTPAYIISDPFGLQLGGDSLLIDRSTDFWELTHTTGFGTTSNSTTHAGWLVADNVLGLGWSGGTLTGYLNGAPILTLAAAWSPGGGFASLAVGDSSSVDNFRIVGQTACP